MKQESLISVVMPVYNGGKYLQEAIESILNQTYQHFEFLIINDGSTDTSEEIIRSYNDPRIVYLQNDKNRGLVYTLNYGIRVAKGDFIARMDADDISEHTRFEKQLEVFKSDPEIEICGTWAQIIGSNFIIKVETESEKIKCNLLFTTQFLHPSVMFNKEKLTKSGFNYDDEKFPAEDYALWINLSEKSRMTNISEPLLRYRKHASQISTASNERQLKKVNELRIEQIVKFLNYEPSEDEKIIHFLICENQSIIPNDFNYNKIHEWYEKLLSLNKTAGYYHHKTLIDCFNTTLSNRILYQHYKNNTPLFLLKFYLFYFHHNYKFKLSFHIKYCIKCLILYKPNLI